MCFLVWSCAGPGFGLQWSLWIPSIPGYSMIPCSAKLHAVFIDLYTLPYVWKQPFHRQTPQSHTFWDIYKENTTLQPWPFERQHCKMCDHLPADLCSLTGALQPQARGCSWSALCQPQLLPEQPTRVCAGEICEPPLNHISVLDHGEVIAAFLPHHRVKATRKQEEKSVGISSHE